MKKQISNISVWQAARIVGILLFLLAACVTTPAGIIMFVTGCLRHNLGAALSGLLFALIPVAYGVLYGLITALAAWGYNCVASRYGGIELTLIDVSEIPAPTGLQPIEPRQHYALLA